MVAAIKQCAVGNKRQPTDTFTLRQLLLLLLLSTLQRPPQCPGPQIVAATPEICSCANSCPVPLRLSLFLSLLAFFSLSLFVHFDQVEFDKKNISLLQSLGLFPRFPLLLLHPNCCRPHLQLRTSVRCVWLVRVLSHSFLCNRILFSPVFTSIMKRHEA